MLVQTNQLKFSHPNQKELVFPDITLEAGESLLVLGKSGSGKTTLLNLLAGLNKPSSGEITINGKVISKLSGHDLDKFRGQEIGIIFQKPHLLAAINVRENLQLAQYFNPNKGQDITALLEELGLASKEKSSVLTLSEGEAQRVSIARALVNSPKVILADEPTSSLDDENTEKVVSLLKNQAAKIGAALIIVTHDHRVKNQISNFIEVTSS